MDFELGFQFDGLKEEFQAHVQRVNDAVFHLMRIHTVLLPLIALECYGLVNRCIAPESDHSDALLFVGALATCFAFFKASAATESVKMAVGSVGNESQWEYWLQPHHERYFSLVQRWAASADKFLGQAFTVVMCLMVTAGFTKQGFLGPSSIMARVLILALVVVCFRDGNAFWNFAERVGIERRRVADELANSDTRPVGDRNEDEEDDDD